MVKKQEQKDAMESLDLIQQSRTNNLVKYRNEVAELRHPLTLYEARIFMLIASQYHQDANLDDAFPILWDDFKEATRGHVNGEKKIIEIMESLRVKKIITNMQGEQVHHGYISEYRIKKGEYVNVLLPSGMHCFLNIYAVGSYCSGDLEVFISLPNSYSTLMYLWLTRFLYRTKTDIPPVSLAELRHILNIEDGLYQTYSNFRRRVLDSIQKNFKKHSDITFEFSGLKLDGGKRITHVQFAVKKNARFQRKLFPRLKNNKERHNKRFFVENINTPKPELILNDGDLLTFKNTGGKILTGTVPESWGNLATKNILFEGDDGSIMQIYESDIIKHYQAGRLVKVDKTEN